MANDEDTFSMRSQTVASVSTTEHSAACPGSVADSVASDASARTVVASQASGKQPRHEMLGDTDAQGFTELKPTKTTQLAPVQSSPSEWFEQNPGKLERDR